MLNRKHWHKDITDQAIQEACARRLSSLDNPGFCLACGAEVEGIEPDAEDGECEICGAEEVCGAEEILMAGAI